MQAEVSENFDAEQGLALDEETLDPNMHYYWGHVRSTRQSRLRKKGYRPTLRSQDKVRTILDEDPEEGESVDDLIQDGDLILMQKEKEGYDRTVARRRRITSSRLEAAEQDFKNKAAHASSGLEKPIRVIGKDKED